jgi:hypothetical protein
VEVTAMVQSNATTVEAYLAELAPERRASVEAVRAVVLDNLPEGYEESMLFGMITYSVPLSRYPETYNKKPLCYAALAAQKNHFSLYLMNVYAGSDSEARFRAAWAKSGKKLDMGKSCVRFRSAGDLALDLVGKTIAATPAEAFIGQYEASRAARPAR